MNRDNHSDYLKKESGKAQWREEFCRKIVEEMNSEERFVNYFAQYEPDSVKSFIDYYAKQKIGWHEHADSSKQLRQWKENRWTEIGWKVLQHIQKKKLFNMECLWRANRLKIEQIEIAFDFTRWDYAALSCPFVPPVEEHEVQAYCDFLNQLDPDASFSRFSTPSFYFHRFRDEGYESENDESPHWYYYYDERFDTRELPLLPDERGRKEKFYMEIHNKFERAQNPLPERKPYIPDERPQFWHHERKIMDPLVKLLETPEVTELYEAWRRDREEGEFIEAIQSDIWLLQDAKEYVSVESDDDWRNAIARCAEQYSRKKTIEALPRVWEEYRKRLSAGTEFPGEKQEFNSVWRNNQVKWLKHGRLLNGEPEDLNF